MEENKKPQVNLYEILKGMPMTEFKWINFRMDTATSNEDENEIIKILIFELETPMERVVGSQVFTADQEKVHITEYNVEEISCPLSFVKDYPDDFHFELDGDNKPTGPGEYKGDLILDVAQSYRVWLVKEKLSRSSSNWRRKFKDDKAHEILARANKHGK